MTVLHILGHDSNRAWNDWGGRGFRKKSFSERLKATCPSLRLTERKRIAQSLADAVPLRLVVEVPEQIGLLTNILEAPGVLFSIEEEANPATR